MARANRLGNEYACANFPASHLTTICWNVTAIQWDVTANESIFSTLDGSIAWNGLIKSSDDATANDDVVTSNDATASDGSSDGRLACYGVIRSNDDAIASDGCSAWNGSLARDGCTTWYGSTTLLSTTILKESKNLVLN